MVSSAVATRVRARFTVQLAVISLSAAAVTLATVNVQASSWHVRYSGCSVTALTSAPQLDIYASCPFTMPSGKPATTTTLGIKRPTGSGLNNHAWGQLTPSWDPYYDNKTLSTYSPMMSFRIVCSPALSDWANSETYTSGWYNLSPGYSRGFGGTTTPDQRCPSNKPVLLGAVADTQVNW
jgi:hypothetical protein